MSEWSGFFQQLHFNLKEKEEEEELHSGCKARTVHWLVSGRTAGICELNWGPIVVPLTLPAVPYLLLRGAVVNIELLANKRIQKIH